MAVIVDGISRVQQVQCHLTANVIMVGRVRHANSHCGLVGQIATVLMATKDTVKIAEHLTQNALNVYQVETAVVLGKNAKRTNAKDVGVFAKLCIQNE